METQFDQYELSFKEKILPNEKYSLSAEVYFLKFSNRFLQTSDEENHFTFKINATIKNFEIDEYLMAKLNDEQRESLES